jgi:putative transposase
MVVEGSRPIAQVARELGVSETALGNWVRAYRETQASDEPPLELSERARLRELERHNRELEMENAFLKKRQRTLQGASVSDKYAFIYAEYAAGCAPSIERMCRWLQVSRSGYYEWLHRSPSATAQRRQLLKIKIAALFEASDGTYGYRRLHQALVAGGDQVGEELVRELRRELGLVACQPRPWRTTTVRGEEHSTAADLVDRDFTADAPGGFQRGGGGPSDDCSE